MVDTNNMKRKLIHCPYDNPDCPICHPSLAEEKCKHSYLEGRPNCIRCGESRITISQSKQTWEEEYCKKFGLCKKGGKCQCKDELKFISAQKRISYEEGLNIRKEYNDPTLIKEIKDQLIKEAVENGEIPLTMREISIIEQNAREKEKVVEIIYQKARTQLIKEAVEKIEKKKYKDGFINKLTVHYNDALEQAIKIISKYNEISLSFQRYRRF